MAAPRLNRKMTLEEARRTPDGAGGFTRDWVALGTLWAELRAGSGRAGDAGLFAAPDVGHRVIVRAAPPGAASRPQPGHRLRAGNRRFAVEAVSDLGTDGRYLVCYAREETET
ncbi:MAG: head-tail adaptor protein [Rhodobacteraceae bacterium]|jgi:head-tail adaptor|nr:head-tail adaptor protein [Paracoccaceae bacterium]